MGVERGVYKYSGTFLTSSGAIVEESSVQAGPHSGPPFFVALPFRVFV